MSQLISRIWSNLHIFRKKSIYTYAEGYEDDNILSLLGDKGVNLCELNYLKVKLPHGFIISSKICYEYSENETHELSHEFHCELMESIKELEIKTHHRFGDYKTDNTFPLLLSIRSGVSIATQMPGRVFKPILNLGLNENIVKRMADITENAYFAYETYMKFLQNYGESVYDIPTYTYDEIYSEIRSLRCLKYDDKFSLEEILILCSEFKGLCDRVPYDVYEQLDCVIRALYDAWYNPRAVRYRELKTAHPAMTLDNCNSSYEDVSAMKRHQENIIQENYTTYDVTSIIVQAMVHGNFNSVDPNLENEDNPSKLSGCGIMYSRDTQTGENITSGDYLLNSIGKELLSCVFTTKSIYTLPSIILNQLTYTSHLLERYYKDIMEMYFVIQENNLFFIQSRVAPRSVKAGIRSAVAMVREQLITEREALLRVDSTQMNVVDYPMIDPTLLNEYKQDIIGKGTSVSVPSVVSGEVVFTTDDAIKCHSMGIKTILCKEFFTRSDIAGLQFTDAVIASKNGLSNSLIGSLRTMCKPAIIGNCWICIDTSTNCVCCGKDCEIRIIDRDVITVDASTGIVYRGKVQTIPASCDENYSTLLYWCDKYSSIEVLSNYECFQETQNSLTPPGKTEGIGLYTTENMYFMPECLEMMRSFLLATMSSLIHKYLVETANEYNVSTDTSLENNSKTENDDLLDEMASISKIVECESTDTKKTMTTTQFIPNSDEHNRRLNCIRLHYLSKILSKHVIEYEKILTLFPNKQIKFRLLNAELHEFLPSKPKRFTSVKEDKTTNEETRPLITPESVSSIPTSVGPMTVSNVVIDIKSSSSPLTQAENDNDSIYTNESSLSYNLPPCTKDEVPSFLMAKSKLPTTNCDLFKPDKNNIYWQEVKTIAANLHIDAYICERTIRDIHEINPIIGCKGCRLSIQYPDITHMQVSAMLLAASNLRLKHGFKQKIQILIPLISVQREVDYIANIIQSSAREVCEHTGVDIEYEIGIILEVPRALLIVDHIIKNTPSIKFISIDTELLTQMTYGFGRDESNLFMPTYIDKNIFHCNPFDKLDERGVGMLIRSSVLKIKKLNKNVKIGLVGHHATDKASINFFNELGIDYISCSPYYIPSTKLACAQVNIEKLQANENIHNELWKVITETGVY